MTIDLGFLSNEAYCEQILFQKKLKKIIILIICLLKIISLFTSISMKFSYMLFDEFIIEISR